jgi:hypothetical protein
MLWLDVKLISNRFIGQPYNAIPYVIRHGALIAIDLHI